MTEPSERTQPTLAEWQDELNALIAHAGNLMRSRSPAEAQQIAGERDRIRLRILAALGENRRLRVALHDAIRRPLGVVPDSAAPFYDPNHAALLASPAEGVAE